MSEQKKTSVELLPGGEFIITDSKEQKIKGRFSMYALDRFCDLKKVDSYLILLEKITIGMRLKDYADLILIAFQDYHRKRPEDVKMEMSDVMDMVDELGGVSSTAFNDLIKHAIGRVADMKKIDEAMQKQLEGESKEEKDKKKEEQ